MSPSPEYGIDERQYGVVINNIATSEGDAQERLRIVNSVPIITTLRNGKVIGERK